jgi:hypothetical protein
MFLVAVDENPNNLDLSIGQTAFVVGSHTLEVSERVMTASDGLAQLKTRLVRPHLSAGDALLFDCRILHFGLANQSSTVNLQNTRSVSELYRECLFVAKARAKGNATVNSSVDFSVPGVSNSLVQDIHQQQQTSSHQCSGDKDTLPGIISSDNRIVPKRRPMLYVNYHHEWFHDPKNWNDKEKLFV